jgi:hypothetical protein
MIVLFSRSSRILKPNQSYKASHGEPLSDTKNRTVIAGQKLTKMRSKKKIVINPELSPFEKIREQNIAERMALLVKLGFCEEKKELKIKTKTVKKRIKVP